MSHVVISDFNLACYLLYYFQITQNIRSDDSSYACDLIFQVAANLYQVLLTFQMIEAFGTIHPRSMVAPVPDQLFNNKSIVSTAIAKQLKELVSDSTV